jgi:Holliday junction resolvase RusA-like endonuclease
MITIEYNGSIPRVNQRYYKNFSLRPEYREAKERLAWSAKIAMKGQEPFKCPISVDIQLDSKTVRGDIDSPIKGILDSFQGILYNNDKQIKRLTIEFFDIPCKILINVDKI